MLGIERARCAELARVEKDTFPNTARPVFLKRQATSNAFFSLKILPGHLLLCVWEFRILEVSVRHIKVPYMCGIVNFERFTKWPVSLMRFFRYVWQMIIIYPRSLI